MSTILPVPEVSSNPDSFSFGGYATPAQGLQGVGFWPRAAARVIDLLLHLLVSVCTGFLMGIMVAILAISAHQSPTPMIQRMAHREPLAFLLAIVGALAYGTICEAVHGSTLGKLIFSMVVVKEDGSPCGFKASLIRNLGYYVDSLFFGLIGYSAMNRGPEQQRYGDSWAHTIVSKRSQIPLEKQRSAGRFILGLLLGCMADSAILMFSMVIRLAA